MLTALLGLDTNELRTIAEEEGEPAFRGTQVAEWLYRGGARTIEEMTNLPEALRVRLGAKYRVGRSRVVIDQHSKDGTVKLLLATHDDATVETVGLPYPDRVSCCVSTQVGCPIGCVFCATGMSGYARNLTDGEIVDQVLSVQEAMRDNRTLNNRRIDHVTFMGMGEPMLNYEATLKAVRLLNREMGIAMRQLTISTVGMVPGIRRLALEGLQVTLAVSLHAPNDALRRQLVPGMSRWSVAEIVDACRDYVRRTSRRVTFEYCLLDGVNDGPDEANELTRVLHGINCHVNLIACNPVPGLTVHPPSRLRVRAFRDTLDNAGIQVTQRVQRGSDIDAACGQLRRRAAAR